ncbi:MAG: hypothetical protein IAI48_01865 [Candidatus Eremiobacteraeota bacterium]|nr:hypothetical protein [Candidatus Eremiobacteraeota bacterium]
MLQPLIAASRVRVGSVRIRGVPAILCGVAAIVAAAGASAALQRVATIVPETLREARLLWIAVRADRPGMLS